MRLSVGFGKVDGTLRQTEFVKTVYNLYYLKEREDLE